MENSLFSTVSTFVNAFVKVNGMGAKIGTRKALTNKDFKVGTKNNRTPVFALIEKGIVADTEYVNATIGRSYEGSVNNRKEGEEKFKAQPMKGRVWVKGLENLIEQSTADTNKHYLRVYLNKNTTTDTKYFVAGKEATEEQLAIIKEYRNKPKSSFNRQHEAGVKEGDEVILNSISLDNLAYVQYGARKLTLK